MTHVEFKLTGFPRPGKPGKVREDCITLKKSVKFNKSLNTEVKHDTGSPKVGAGKHQGGVVMEMGSWGRYRRKGVIG